MSSGVFVHTFALAFRKMSSAIAKAGPSKEAAPVLETPEKDRHKERFEEMMGSTAVWRKGLLELRCAILEAFNILCNLWSKIIHLRKVI